MSSSDFLYSSLTISGISCLIKGSPPVMLVNAISGSGMSREQACGLRMPEECIQGVVKNGKKNIIRHCHRDLPMQRPLQYVCRSPVRPGCTSSGAPPRSEASTGVPYIWDSITENGQFSYHSDGYTLNLAPAINAKIVRNVYR